MLFFHILVSFQYKKITQKCNKILISSFFAVHEKRKQFECQVCAHQFARKHHLSKHILAVHAKVKPYGCQQCDQSFLQRHHLGAHIMSVHQPPIQEEADGTKVPFIYYVSTCIAQNSNLTFKFLTKNCFFRQNKAISVSTLHFDEIF